MFACYELMQKEDYDELIRKSSKPLVSGYWRCWLSFKGAKEELFACISNS